MNPLSITAAAVSLAGVVAKTTIAITDFIRTTRSARQDFISTSRHLGELSSTLDLLSGDNTDRLSESVQSRIQSVLKSCESILGDINTALSNYKDGTGPVRWALAGKTEVETLNKQLEIHLRILNLAVDVTTL